MQIRYLSEMCRDIIDNGTSTEGEKVRPVWEDGTPAYTIKKFGVVNRYDLIKRISGADSSKDRNQELCGRTALDLAEEIQQYSRSEQPYLGQLGG